MVERVKVCSSCKEEQLETNYYYTSSRGYKYLSHTCKKCHNQITKNWGEKNWERRLQIAKEGQWRYLGIDVKEAYRVLEAPPNCKICGSTENLVLDHCHQTKKVRGRLCNDCNLGLGNFKDNPNFLLKAVAYLTG